jgi:hypothetical protein
MRFNLTIYADSAAELKAALKSITDNLPVPIFEDAGVSTFSIEAFSSKKKDADAPAQNAPATDAAIRDAAVRDEAKPATRGSRKAKATTEGDAAETKAPEPEPETPTTIAPKEAKDQALDILRECFELEHKPGDAAGAKAVKALQNEMGVTKFVQVPDERGVELLDKAKKLRATFGATSTDAGAPVGDEADLAENDADADADAESVGEMAF